MTPRGRPGLDALFFSSFPDTADPFAKMGPGLADINAGEADSVGPFINLSVLRGSIGSWFFIRINHAFLSAFAAPLVRS